MLLIAKTTHPRLTKTIWVCACRGSNPVPIGSEFIVLPIERLVPPFSRWFPSKRSLKYTKNYATGIKRSNSIIPWSINTKNKTPKVLAYDKSNSTSYLKSYDNHFSELLFNLFFLNSNSPQVYWEVTCFLHLPLLIQNSLTYYSKCFRDQIGRGWYWMDIEISDMYKIHCWQWTSKNGRKNKLNLNEELVKRDLVIIISRIL